MGKAVFSLIMGALIGAVLIAIVAEVSYTKKLTKACLYHCNDKHGQYPQRVKWDGDRCVCEYVSPRPILMLEKRKVEK